MKGAIMKDSVKEKLIQMLLIVFTLCVVVITLYPVIYVLFASFSEPKKFLIHTGLLLRPVGFSLISYEKAFQHPLIVHSYLVTLFVLITGTAVNLVMTTLGAYVISRKNLYFKRFLSVFMIFTMYFSGGLIPFYLTVKGIGLLDNILSLILPTAINTFNLIILRTAFLSIPDSIEEAAVIDGAGSAVTLFRVLVPLALPTMAVLTLYYAVTHWNSWFNASIFLYKPELYPLQLVMRQILMQGDSQSMTISVDTGDQLAVSETLKYAVIVIATVPILCVYPFLQRFFEKGVMVGAVKG